jgi:hypothetical protein
LERAEASQLKLSSLQQHTETKFDTVESLPPPEPLIYYAAIELARDASVNEVLGNLSQAYTKYESARLLMESVLLTADAAVDRKVLKQYADMFAVQQDTCRRTNDILKSDV